MKIDKRTALVVGSSVAIGFIGDLIIYSLAESKGKPFRIHMPKGKELVKLLSLGIVTGLVLDFAVKKAEYAIMSKEERSLLALVNAERARISKGEVSGKAAQKVDWA